MGQQGIVPGWPPEALRKSCLRRRIVTLENKATLDEPLCCVLVCKLRGLVVQAQAGLRPGGCVTLSGPLSCTQKFTRSVKQESSVLFWCAFSIFEKLPK